MICPSCHKETQPGFFCHACDIFTADPSVGVNAGLGRRLGAHLLDIVAAWLAFLLISAGSCAFGSVGASVGGVGGQGGYAAGSGCGTCLTTMLFGLSGYTVFALWFLAQGKTPGKWLVNVRVIDKSTGGNPGLGRMLVREIVGKIASGLFFGVGYFWAIWDPARQCWHDKIAGTLVVREATSPAPPVPAPAVIEIGRSTTNAPAEVSAVALPEGKEGSHSTSGTLVPETAYCADCGASVSPTDGFCEQCGTQLGV